MLKSKTMMFEIVGSRSNVKGCWYVFEEWIGMCSLREVRSKLKEKVYERSLEERLS